ncbi:MAG: FtsX-like permease family protein [Muribaculaceae bacterium]|nr:FtsX-like permease family protein [Muribaculaceae bacterium]
MVIHNFKVALRNLMKYKLQTLISVVSIAIGIVTLSLTHSIMTRFRLPSIYFESYYDRTYRVSFKSMTDGNEVSINKDILRTVKGNGGLRNAEKIAVPNGITTDIPVEFHLSDSTVRKGRIMGNFIDPEYPNYIGLQSAVTGKKIRVLKAGEGIISEDFAKTNFPDKNPIGAVQAVTGLETQPIPITIVDIYKSPSAYDQIVNDNRFYYCIGDKIEDLELPSEFYAIWMNVVLKENSTKQQLAKEINDRVKPLGLEAKISSATDKSEINMLLIIRLLGYTVGSLILLAAIIGFLKIHTQLLHIRHREVSLRLVNGATRVKLFNMLFTETAIAICLAIIVSFILGVLLQDFCDNNLVIFTNGEGIKIQNLALTSIVIGGVLLAICSLIEWIILLRISKARKGLARNMRRGQSHLFRNIMLGIQIVISIIFVCSTFILVKGGDRLLKACNIPDNEDTYKEYLYLFSRESANRQQLIEELRHLPNLDKMLMANRGYSSVNEVLTNPEIVDKLHKEIYFSTYCTTDTVLISALGMDVEWLNKNTPHNEGLLISEDLYELFGELGLLGNNTLTPMVSHKGPSTPLPIIGIIKNIPYETTGKKIVVIMPDWEDTGWDYLLVPKEGKGKALAQSVNETIERIEPELINQIVFNYREGVNHLPGYVEVVRTGGWILGIVSLIICAMSIFSTIALDTRARRKEVAIRKVNGAKNYDIYRLFGRTYLVLIVVSLFIAIPLCVLFNRVIESLVQDMAPEATLSPVGPIILGSTIVVLLILLIVGWQIHKVMQIDPAKIIAKE